MLTSAEFARQAGVSRAAVCNGIKVGRIIQTDKKLIDETDPVNVEYLQHRKNLKKKPESKPVKPVIKKTKDTLSKKEHEPKTTLDPIEPIDIPVDDENDQKINYDSLDKLNVDVRLKYAQAQRHELKFHQDKGDLVLKSELIKAVSKIQAEIKTRIQDLPRRISPRILALAESGNGVKVIESEMQKEIDDAFESIRVAFEKHI